MKLQVIFFSLAVLMIAGCNESDDSAQGRTVKPASESIFGDMLSGIDKAKAAQGAMNDRQKSLDASSGYNEHTSGPEQNLGMIDADAAKAMAEKKENDSIFGGMLNAVDKAKATNQMMNSRQATLDAMWGVESQSSQGGEPAAVADGEQVADEDGDDESASGDSMDVLDKAKALQQAANERQKHLDAMWGVESQSSAP